MAPVSTPHDQDQPQISFLAFVNTILRNRHRMVQTGLVLAIVIGAYTLTRPRSYTSKATVLVQAPRGTTASNIATQLGLVMPRADAGQSPEFYAELVSSREILGQLAMSRFVDASRARTYPLWRLIGIDAKDSLSQSDEAMRKLDSMISASVSQKTGLVTIAVRSLNRSLSQAVATRCIELVNIFNREQRQTQALAERKFTEQRFAETSAELRAAENRLQDFLRVNRGDVRGSPNLSFEFDRLQRDVNLRQQVYTSLAQAYEQAKIEEVRDNPAITTIDSPSYPLKPDSRGFLRNTSLALFGGAILALLWSMLMSLFSPRSATDPDEAHEYERLRLIAKEEIRRPWRLVFGDREQRDHTAVV